MGNIFSTSEETEAVVEVLQEFVYTMKHMKGGAEQAVKNISSLTSFKSTIHTRLAIFDNKEEVLEHLRFIEDTFTWFTYDTSGLEHTRTFFCRDVQGIDDIFLTGYLIMCDHCRNGKYIFRCCVVEFHEEVTFKQLAYKLFDSLPLIAGSASTFALMGGSIALPFDAITPVVGSTVGACAGAVVGAVDGVTKAIMINRDDESRRKAVEEKLGAGLYDAGKDRVNDHAIVEAVCLHFVLADQRYTFDGEEVRISGVNKNDTKKTTS